MFQSNRNRMVAALVCLAGIPAAGFAVNLGERIPNSAHIAFWVDDLSAARENSLENPFFALLADKDYGVGSGTDAVSRTLARIPVSSADPLGPIWQLILPEVGFSIASGIESATSVFHFTSEDIVETFSGSMAIYSTLYKLYEENDVEIIEWDVILTADYEEDQREDVDRFMEEALKRVPDQASRRLVEYHGHEVYQIRYYLEEQVKLPGDHIPGIDLLQEFEVIVEYAHVDGVFLLAEGRGEPLRRAIGALVSDNPSLHLHESPRYRRASESLKSSTGNFHLYYDISHQIRQMENLRTHGESLKFFNLLGLTNAGPVLANLTIDGDEARIDLGISSGESPSGIFRLLSTFPENRLESLRYVPADAKTFGTITLDVKSAYDYFKAVYREVAPSMAIAMDVGLQTIENQFQIRVVDDLFSQIVGESVTYMRDSTSPSATGRTTVSTGWYFPFGGDMDLVGQFNQAIRQLAEGDIRLLDAESSDVDGVTLWELRTPMGRQQGAPPISIAVSTGGLIAGDDGSEARELLRRISGQGTGDIRSNSDVEQILRDVDRDSLIGFVYTNGGALVDELLRTAAFIPGARTPPEDMLRASLGDSWWSLQARDTGLLFSFTIMTPNP
ncbi:MAG: hypothetical protein JJU11_00750 [Candidatus Sumerlaeia bacterium]|nr:hypothetical protein [Candidatus Sumerlaeia bacterium]